jgi:hypothetical protein
MTHDYDVEDDYEEDRAGRRAEDWPHSGVGVASFIIGILVLLLGLAGMGLAVVAAVQAQRSGHPPAAAMVGGMLIIGAVILALAGTGLGIGGVCQRHRKKVFGIIGLCINGLALLGGLGIMLLGVMFASGR